MIRVNENFSLLQGSYLFAEVNRRVREYQAAHPDKKVIRMGIGDVTEPLTPTVIRSLSDGVKEMSARESFKGYSPDQGYDFLREAICRTDFDSRGVPMDITEIFVSTGAKEDTANIQELFGQDIRIAIPDPVYPVYVDSNVMAGRSGPFVDGRYKNFIYLECSAENQFKPSLPSQPVDLIYLCFPNNPTGQVLTKAELQAWVEYARASKALILFDAAYEAFIRDPSIPRSIYEIEGAREVAIEFRSLSKTAGFTGTRCAYTVVPKECAAFDSAGSKVLLNPLWARRQGTKFNGVAYIIQKGAAAVYTPEGQKEARDLIDFYLGNARIARDVLTKLGISCTGGDNSPYIWLKTPGKLSSWDFFDKLLAECQVVGTPGSGFGRNGEGYFRLSSFNSRENVKVAMERFSGLRV